MKKIILVGLFMITTASAEQYQAWRDTDRTLFVNMCIKAAAKAAACKCVIKKIEEKYPNLYDYVDAQKNGELDSYIMEIAPECKEED